MKLPLLLLPALCGGCLLGPDFERPDASPYVPDAFRTGPAPDAAPDASPQAPCAPAVSEAQWWAAWNDPLLERLLEQGSSTNLTLLQAEARLRQSRATLDAARASLFPSLGLSGSASRSKTFDPDASRSSYRAGGDAAWEIDLFGRNRRTAEAAEADLEASGLSVDDARLSLRGVPPATVVELLCSSLGLWRRPDPATGVPTILTLEEYERELASFREERTEAFTLLYPNVIEVASVLYGLFPDRVYLTLGEQGVLEDERNELSRRFNRFRMIDDALPSTGFAASSGGRVSVPGGSTSVFGYDDNRHDRTKDEPAGPATYSGLTREEAERLEAARASGDEEAARAVLAAHRDRPPSIFVTVSRRNNLVIVRTGDAEAMEQIRRLIRRLDVPTPTVLLEMKVMEFSVDDGFNSTFEYEFVTDTRSNGNDYRSEAGFPGFSPLSNAGRTDAFSYRLLSEHFNMRIQMLEKNGKARTIATPMLLVANNEVSRLFIGDEVPITTGVSLEPVTSTTSSGVTAVTGYTVEPETSIRSIGTTLLVTPSINADRTVTLHLLEEESSVIRNGGSIPYGDAQSLQSFSVDTVESRRVSGTFIAMDGLIAAVGGLIRETESEQESRIPVLGSIPLIGFLFRSTERVKERTELVIFIRPHVLSTPAEGERESRRLLETLSRSPDLGSVFEPAPLEPDGFRPADPVERVLEGRLAAEPPAPGPEAQTGDAAAR